MDREGFGGCRVLAFESRRAVEMAELIRRHGGEPLAAPAMREVPRSDLAVPLAHLERLAAGAVDVVILMTGVGLRSLIKSVAPTWPTQRLATALRSTTTVARGPKPVAAMREIGLTPNLTVPPPNTWREILATLDAHYTVAGRCVAVHEYGVANPAFIAGLRERGATVETVPIYTWALPEDTQPLRAGIAALLEHRIDVALFTSASQVHHLFGFAEGTGVPRTTLQAALNATVVGSIGPVCSEALGEFGVTPAFEPEPAKLGPFVRQAAQHLAARAAAGRS